MAKAVSKRLIALLLVTMMIVSVLPIHAFAFSSESKTTDAVKPIESNPFTEKTLLNEVKSQMDAILDKYLGSNDLTPVAVEDAVLSLEENKLINAWEECNSLNVKAEPLTDAEEYFLKRYESSATYDCFYGLLSEIFATKAEENVAYGAGSASAAAGP